MIKLKVLEVSGWFSTVHGMRNPMNSWEKSDSHYDSIPETDDIMVEYVGKGLSYMVVPNDQKLMASLASAGSPSHRKFMRMINAYIDITAPLYWWKEFDTYKVGTVANSCSTMHKIHEKEFTLDDFSCEHLFNLSEDDDDSDCYVETWVNDLLGPTDVLQLTVDMLNKARNLYLEYQKKAAEGNEFAKTHVKEYWWQMIQLLPSSYNQKRTVMLNYETLANIYRDRKDHKLDEWKEFCQFIEGLRYAKLIKLAAREEEVE